MRHPMLLGLAAITATGCTYHDPNACKNDFDCPNAIICEAGSCVAPPPMVVEHYGECTSDDQCQGEAKCRKGACVETVTVIVPGTGLEYGVKFVQFKLPNTPPASASQPLLFTTAVPVVKAPSCNPAVKTVTFQMTRRTGMGVVPAYAFRKDDKPYDPINIKDLGGAALGGFSGWYFNSYQIQDTVVLPAMGTRFDAWCTDCDTPMNKPNIDVNIFTELTGISWEEYENGPRHEQNGGLGIYELRLF